MDLVSLTSAEPEALRRSALQALMGATDADIGLFYRAVQRPDGPAVIDSLCVGSAQLTHLMHNYQLAGPPAGAACDASSEALDARRKGWSLERPPESARNKFQSLYADYRSRDAFAELAVYRELYGPLEIIDQLRLLTYEGSQFVGWIGVLRRRGAAEFSRRDLSHANRLAPAIQAQLCKAVAISQLGDSETGQHAIFSSSGKLEYCSHELAGWFNSSRAALFKQMVERVVTAGVATHELDGVRIDWARLDPPSGSPCYLARLSHYPALQRTTLRLTATEHAIATEAARGDRVREIAERHAISENTVKFHLRNAYSKLGVSTRIQLARALDLSPH
ncbi:MAG: helix-turn-helix transcriptional regulator [Polyangiaceae bacterium]